MTPHQWTLEQTRRELETKACSAEELVHHFQARIAKYNPTLHAFVTLSDTVLEQARQVDERRSKGLPLGPLAGVPIAVKDLFDTANMRTTYGGKHYAQYIPDHSATAVTRLVNAGAIVIGKTNLHEYAYGTTTENPHYGNATNPWNRYKISGGSSGGSSVAIAAGLSTVALGTDTGGSIRIPAALTGHVGLKPTYGLVSAHGVFPLAHTLDHVGPMTKTVQDAALLLSIMAGPDPNESRAITVPLRNYDSYPVQFPVRVGIPRQFFYDKCQPTVLQVVQNALHQLQGSEFSFQEVDVPHIHDVPEAQNAIIASEALSVHQQMIQEQPELYGDDVRGRLEMAIKVSGSQYVQATQFRQHFIHQLRSVFEQVDVIITPTTPLPATDLGQFKTHVRTLEVNVRGHLTRYTNPWNLSGMPALTIPCGLTADGLPVGLQVVGWRFTEPKLLAIGMKIEKAFTWEPIAPDYR